MMATPSTENSRFRSFAERYLIARAASFTKGDEEREAWDCILRAKSIYKKVKEVAGGLDREIEEAERAGR